MTLPKDLVTIICLAHNHAAYIQDAVDSVEKQTHANLELILVDDGSTDGSKKLMSQLSADRGYPFIDLKAVAGNCAAFNKALEAANGQFVIDLAADDLLEPERVERGLKDLSDPQVGVNFCDVRFIDSLGASGTTHFQRDKDGKLSEEVPSGDLYAALIHRYFISPPSMMIKKEVLTELGGYDESLSFEDFDFWIRSSRNWHYSFTDAVLVKKRVLDRSLSGQQNIFRNRHQKTILEVCKKIKELNQSRAEKKALRNRIFYEVRRCIRYGNFELIPEFLLLL